MIFSEDQVLEAAIFANDAEHNVVATNQKEGDDRLHTRLLWPNLSLEDQKEYLRRAKIIAQNISNPFHPKCYFEVYVRAYLLLQIKTGTLNVSSSSSGSQNESSSS